MSGGKGVQEFKMSCDGSADACGGSTSRFKTEFCDNEDTSHCSEGVFSDAKAFADNRCAYFVNTYDVS